ncbi:MAG: hypothetical protein JW953_02460 [Anaerolineae bacterium]|nr:hypothetical protein [Anaerolineae bacterium]
MFWLFLGLTILSIIILIAGMVWTLATSGQTQRRNKEEVGKKMVADMMRDDLTKNEVILGTDFKGKATGLKSEATFSFADIKAAVQAGQWQSVLPILLALGGMLGLFLFGPMALWFGIESKLVAGLLMVVALYAIIRTIISFARA